MDFKIDAVLPATAAQLWTIFFDIERVAALIPGCENVREIEPLKEYSAVMKQRVGPFKLEVPARILVESYTLQQCVALRVDGRDRLTGTTVDVVLDVALEDASRADAPSCRLALSAQMRVAGRLASLGFGVVKKRSEEIFAEFEQRLRNELAQAHGEVAGQAPAAAPAVTAAAPAAAAPRPAVERAAGTVATAATAPGVAKAAASPPPALPAQARRPAGGWSLHWQRAAIGVGAGTFIALGVQFFGPGWAWISVPLLGIGAGLYWESD